MVRWEEAFATELQTQADRNDGRQQLTSRYFLVVTSVQQYSYDCSYKKDPVPKATDKPVLGLHSNKNFIVTNAVENILSVPKAAKSEANWLEKKDFGKVPEFL
jgi:hypothetical protein